MLGSTTFRNPYLAALAIVLVLLPVVLVPVHSHSIGTSRANCSACLVTLSATILSLGATAVLLIRNWRERVEFSPQLVARPGRSSLGRAPPRFFDL